MTTDPDDLPEPPDLDLGLDDMQLGTLSGDIRDAMLTRFRGFGKTWKDMTEAEQQDAANAFDLAARQTVRKAVQLLTSWDWPRVVARLGDMKIIGGEKTRIEVKAIASNIADYRNAIGEHVGSEVMILMVDSEAFLAQRAPAKTEPDQPDLPMGEDVDPSVEQAGAGRAPEEPEAPLSEEEIAAAKAEIAQESADFEASTEELERQTTRGKVRAQREAAA